MGQGTSDILYYIIPGKESHMYNHVYKADISCLSNVHNIASYVSGY